MNDEEIEDMPSIQAYGSHETGECCQMARQYSRWLTNKTGHAS